MKKLFSAFLAATVALSAMATETAYVRMKLAGSNPTYSTSTIKLTENSDRTPAYESGYDSERMMEQSNDNSVLFYAYVGTQECANIATNNLDGLVLCFNTNNIDQNYTISFELVSGRDLTLYDRVTKTSTPIVQDESYPFSVEAAQVGRVAIADRFVIGLPSYTVTMNEYGWASFSSIDDLEIPAGLTAYKGAFSGEELALAEVDYIKANEGVILYGTANQSYVLDLGTGSSDFAGNDLKPASAWASHAGTIYCLKGDALYEYTGATMPANKAYLQVGGASAPRRISLRFNNEQGVENVKADVKAQKFVENGQILIKRGEDVYNLQGQIVK